MKIRNGFVSNSSSSSFFIKVDKNYPNVLSLAKDMLEIKCSVYEQEINFSVLNRIKNKNISIFIPTTNYDTFIYLVSNNYIFVDTCNNISWNINSDMYNFTPNDIGDAMKNYDEYYFKKLKYKFDFLHIENGIMGKVSQNTCNKCYSDLWVVDKKIFCPVCTNLRLLKLKKIKKHIKNHF